ncbi:hypothetical protein BH09ACT13_BH09ACT13_02000 [soil metagenome]
MERNESWRLVTPGGKVVGYGQGLVELTRAMRLTRPASAALGRVPGGALDRLYALLSDNRGLFGRLVPDGPAPRRFP